MKTKTQKRQEVLNKLEPELIRLSQLRKRNQRECLYTILASRREMYLSSQVNSLKRKLGINNEE